MDLSGDGRLFVVDEEVARLSNTPLVVCCAPSRVIDADRNDFAPRLSAVFRPLPDRPDVLRTVSGREAGELLRLTRDDRGAIVRMHWATYRFTRVQEAFDGASPSGG